MQFYSIHKTCFYFIFDDEIILGECPRSGEGSQENQRHAQPSKVMKQTLS